MNRPPCSPPARLSTPRRPRPALAAGLLTLAALLALSAPRPAAAAQALGCLIEPDRVADVGSPVVAVIESVEVERGQPVKKGQVLVVLRAGVERAAFDAARSRADASADVQAAASNAKFNRDRMQRAEDLFRRQFISQQALDQARTESQMADQKLGQAQEQQAISQQERGVAAAQLQQRTIRSPMDGVVAERYMSAGERADEKPLLRIARIDPLRVQLVVPTTLYGQVRPDSPVSVLPDLPGARPVTATVSMVDRVIDPASNTFRVQLTLPNPDLSLPAGLRCRADFGDPPAGSAALAGAPPGLAASLPPGAVAAPGHPAVGAPLPPLTALTLVPPGSLFVPATSPWAGRTNQVVDAPAPRVAAAVAHEIARRVPQVRAVAPADAQRLAAGPAPVAASAVAPVAALRTPPSSASPNPVTSAAPAPAASAARPALPATLAQAGAALAPADPGR